MKYVLGLTLLLAPTYVLRFKLLGLPTNVLMLWLGFVLLIVASHILLTGRTEFFYKKVQRIPLYIRIAIGLFFLSGTVSLLVFGVSLEKFGQWIVLFLQPIALFFAANYILAVWPKSKNFLMFSMYLFISACGIVALAQYITLFGLPREWMGNANEPKRALAFFAHPNAYALFITPILAFLLPNLWQWISSKDKLSKYFFVLAWLLGALGLLLSLSRGGWLGLVFAGAFFVFTSGQLKLKKIAIVSTIAVALVVAVVPNFRYRILLPFHGEKSSVARFSLWNTGWSMVKDDPVLGKGLAGFSNNWDKYNTDPNLEHYNFPHNIFLNFWVDTGLLGMLSFFLLSLFIVFRSLNKEIREAYLPVALFAVAIIAHGLIDIPYLKNDLSVIFWLVLSLI